MARLAKRASNGAIPPRSQALAQSFIQAVKPTDMTALWWTLTPPRGWGGWGADRLSEDLPARSAAPLLNRIKKCATCARRHPSIPGVQVWLEGTRRLVRYFGEEIFVRGNCDQAPFSLACCMRGIENWMLDIPTKTARGRAKAALNTTNVVLVLAAMRRPGAHMLSNGIVWQGRTHFPGLCHELALPAEQEIADWRTN